MADDPTKTGSQKGSQTIGAAAKGAAPARPDISSAEVEALLD
jgi:hypothetical protein